jgi:tartrate-resistant acid phosphatase type 5
MRVGLLAAFVLFVVSCEAPEEDGALGEVDLAGDVRRTVILIYGETAPGQDMFIRGGLDHDRARELLGLDCTPENLLCAIPIAHRNARNPTTIPWKPGDTVLDWYGPEVGQTGTSHGIAAQGTPVDWTTNVWPSEWGPVRRVAVDGYGLEELNHVGMHYWMLDVDMDCSRGFPAGGASWFEVKSYIAGGAGWEPDVHQTGTPYASGNHFAQCGKLNVFRRGVDSARIYRLDRPPPPSMAFVALGDTGKGSSGQWEVARAMESFCRHSGCDFALLLGDNIYDSGASSPTDAQFQSKFEEPYANLRMPFYAVLGNHDYGGGGSGDEFWKGANEVAYSQHSAKWRMPAAHYHLRNENLELFALDTNMQMWARDDQQRQDVGGWLQGSTATWKIAFGHHPYYSNGGHGNAGNYEGHTGVFPWSGDGVKSFMDTVVCGRADLVLSGHDHSRQWMTETCGGTTELVVSGAGGSASSLPGHDPTRFQSAEVGFLHVAIEGDTLTASFVDGTGQVDFSRTLVKASGRGTPGR